MTSRAKILQPVSGRAVTETRHCLLAEVFHSPDPLRAAERGRPLTDTRTVLADRCAPGRMTAWRDAGQADPEFAQWVSAPFGADRHETIATLRADGSAADLGVEAVFEDGDRGFRLDAGRAHLP